VVLGRTAEQTVQAAPSPCAKRLYLVGCSPYTLEADEASAWGYTPPRCHGCPRVWEGPQHETFDHGFELEPRREFGVTHNGFDVEALIVRS